MNAPSALRGRTPSDAAGVSVDVTPVMNVFIILIPFLVGMAVFSTLSVQVIALPDPDATPVISAEAGPLVVAVGFDGIALRHDGTELARFPRSREGWPEDAIVAALTSARALASGPVRAVAAVEDPVRTRDLVACLDWCREAGFADVGVTEGSRNLRSRGTP